MGDNVSDINMQRLCFQHTSSKATMHDLSKTDNQPVKLMTRKYLDFSFLGDYLKNNQLRLNAIASK